MNIPRSRAFLTAAILLLAASWTVPAWANGDCANFFQNLYGSGIGSTWASAGCQTCHTTVPTRNGYGADVGICTVAAIQAAEGLDSDTAAGQASVGGNNLVEISAGAQPGWCVSTTPGCSNVVDPPASITGPLDPPQDNAIPVAMAGGPYEGEAGTPLLFDGSGSSDADGDALIYAWDFGDGSGGSGPSPSHAYASAGSYTVSLVVNDGTADSSADTTTATIAEAVVNQPPVAIAGGPYGGEAGVGVQFDGSGSSDADGDALTYTWDFGDGSAGAGISPVHNYAAAGTYTVSLVVNDGQVDSLADTTTATIGAPVANVPPVADAGGPYEGRTGVVVQFDGVSSSDPNGDAISFLWDFGDGSTGDGPTPGHSYASAADYTVTLVVSDGQADSTPDITTAHIVDAPVASDGEALYNLHCLGCHGDPGQDPAFDEALAGVHTVAGARSCTIRGSVFGTSVFPGGVPAMQFLQGALADGDIDVLSDYLNSATATGKQRYATSCAGCHGPDGSGGRVGEGVRGDSAGDIADAIGEDSAMRYLSCLPASDVVAIAGFLQGTDSDSDGATESPEDSDGSGGGGAAGFWFLVMLAAVTRFPRRRLTNRPIR